MGRGVLGCHQPQSQRGSLLLNPESHIPWTCQATCVSPCLLECRDNSFQNLIVFAPSQSSAQPAPLHPQHARRAATVRRPACHRLCLARVGTTGVACKVGGYSPAGSSNPVPCPAGSCCPAPGLPSPVLCPAGSYCPEYGYQVCPANIPCPGGSTCPAGCMQPQTDSGNGSNEDPNLAWKIVGPIAGVISIVASCAGYLRSRRSSELGQGAGAVQDFAGTWSI